MSDLRQRLAAGSSMLLRQAPTALWAGEWRETISRWFVLALVVAIGTTAVALHPWLWLGVALAPTLAALAVGGTLTDEDQDDEDDGEKLPDVDEDDLLDILWDLVADGRGVHLRAVAERLTLDYPERDWTIADVHALLAASEIETQHSVRMRHAPKGKAVAVGVRVSDLPPRPSPALREGDVAGVDGQLSGATATATPGREVLGEGVGLIVKSSVSQTQAVPRPRRGRRRS